MAGYNGKCIRLLQCFDVLLNSRNILDSYILLLKNFCQRMACLHWERLLFIGKLTFEIFQLRKATVEWLKRFFLLDVVKEKRTE